MTRRAHEGSRGQRRAGQGAALVQPRAEALTAPGANRCVPCPDTPPRSADCSRGAVGAGRASGRQTFTSHDIVIYLFVCRADPVSLSAGKRTWAGGPGTRPQQRARPERRGAAVGLA